MSCPQSNLGFVQAQRITKKHAKTFYFASYFLPQVKKKAAYAVYALCRISDQAVDDQAVEPKLERIAEIKAKIDSAYADSRLKDSLLSAFGQTITKYNIPRDYFNQLLQGMYLDLHQRRYQNFDQLYDYCYKVAGVVGLIMLKIFGYTNPQAEQHAVELGIAMQLTNILRDIKEDYFRGRIYLPQDELARFAVTENSIAVETVNDNLVALLKFQISRARQYYANSSAGIRMIADRRCRFVVLAMKDIYSGILTAIERNAYDVFSQRAYVTTGQKIAIALKNLIKR